MGGRGGVMGPLLRRGATGGFGGTIFDRAVSLVGGVRVGEGVVRRLTRGVGATAGDAVLTGLRLPLRFTATTTTSAVRTATPTPQAAYSHTWEPAPLPAVVREESLLSVRDLRAETGRGGGAASSLTRS